MIAPGSRGVLAVSCVAIGCTWRWVCTQAVADVQRGIDELAEHSHAVHGDQYRVEPLVGPVG